MTKHDTLRQALLTAQRPLILDGAMGTMIQSYSLGAADYRGSFLDLPAEQKGNNDLLCLTRPDIITDIHRRYLAAGADIITTNTFNAQRISLADYGCEHLVRDINHAAVRIAREAGGHIIVGSVGPTNKSLSMSPDINDPALRAITFDELADAYLEQMTALLEGGVDAFLIETIFDTLNAKAAIYAADEAMRQTGITVPVMISATVSDKAGRLLSGQTLEAFIISVRHAPQLLSIGLNCSFGAQEMLPHLRELRSLLAREPIYISAYPNAGLPNQLGQYDETPELMATHIQPFLEEGLVDIIGGCCGTTDEHIRAIKEKSLAIHGQRKQEIAHDPVFSLSGLSPLHLTPDVAFINVGERCNVAGSRKFLRLIKEKNYDEAVGIARKQVEDGALMLDINLDDCLLDTHEEMCHFLNLLAADPDISRVPFMIDSSRWDVIHAALGCVQGKCIVNSISLKEGEAIFLDHARELRRMGAAVIVMAFDEKGQATTYERRTAICQRAYQLLTERVGFPPEDIIFDPNVLAIATGMPEHDRYALDFIRTTQWIKENLPGAHVSGGVSNLSFSFRGNNYLREAMHAVFLYHARQVGMDMAIVNPATSVTYADIPADHLALIEDAILARREDACERLIDSPPALPVREGTVTFEPEGLPLAKDSTPSRLIDDLRRGMTDTLEADLEAALKEYPSALAIIEGPLMEGMNLVGRLFGEGKMFLPQVVKTARTMKRAVDILQPHLTRNTSSSASSPKILVATVKGDVHDIGKNIVATVMACNGYEVIDLGVMVPAETIVAQALELHPDVIGLSGLITPSLEEMVHTVHLLGQAGIRVPVLIGGATTSALHTALKIAPAYEGPVLHVCDASQNVPLAAPFLNPDTAAEATAALAAEQEALRAQAATPSAPTHSLEEARANKPKFFD
ncbi:MAG: methionine synthase [Bacteroidaceae bacterium]|nr:methionine synthase [Bacteroidaceae bacterium]